MIVSCRPEDTGRTGLLAGFLPAKMHFVHSLEKLEIRDSLRPHQSDRGSETQGAHMKRWLTAALLAISLPGAPTLGGELLGITPDELETLKAQGVPVVDVRTPEEWHKTGVIEGSKPLTFFDSKGAYDTAAWMRQLKTIVPDAARPVVLVCRSGNRTAIIGKMLAQELGYERVYHLEKGLQVWSAEGHKLAPCGSC
jgi:rhodanese-related sulfurtransferase